MRKEVRHFNYKPFVIIILAVASGYFLWLYFVSYEKCDNWDCFNGNLELCKKTRFVGGSEMIFEYKILGKSDGRCAVNITLLMGELRHQDAIKIEKKSMTCRLPVGVLMLPESNLGYCSGELKEGFQELLIKKLHTYIVQNVGRINLEILDPREVIRIQ